MERVTTDNEREKRAGTAIVQLAEQFPQLQKENMMLKETFEQLLYHMAVKDKVPSLAIDSARNYLGIKMMEINLQSRL
jgi:hypothetical protein